MDDQIQNTEYMELNRIPYVRLTQYTIRHTTYVPTIPREWSLIGNVLVNSQRVIANAFNSVAVTVARPSDGLPSHILGLINSTSKTGRIKNSVFSSLRAIMDFPTYSRINFPDNLRS